MMVWLDKKFSNANCRDRRKVSAITQRKAADFENNMGRGILRCRDKIFRAPKRWASTRAGLAQSFSAYRHP